MTNSIFTLDTTDVNQSVSLQPTSIEALTEAVWQGMADNIAKEVSLTSYPAHVLEERWAKGRAVVALYKEQIVSYISLVPVLNDPARRHISEIADVSVDQFPQIDINESATGWTHPEWRKKGVSYQLRQQLLGRFDDYNLFVTIAVGLGAAPVVSKLGWRLVDWGEFPFVSSLVGLPIKGLEDKVPVGRRLPPNMIIYRGNHITLDDADHSWQKYCHFWVSSFDTASTLNIQISQLMQNDLPRWRDHFATYLMQKNDPRWKPFLFDEDYG